MPVESALLQKLIKGHFILGLVADKKQNLYFTKKVDSVGLSKVLTAKTTIRQTLKEMMFQWSNASISSYGLNLLSARLKLSSPKT